MRTILFALLVPLAFALQSGAAACQPTTSQAEVDTCVAGMTFPCVYVDNDVCQTGCMFSIWIYQESNGHPGLQRQDEVRDDTCGGQIEGDTIVF